MVADREVGRTAAPPRRDSAPPWAGIPSTANREQSSMAGLSAARGWRHSRSPAAPMKTEAEISRN